MSRIRWAFNTRIWNPAEEEWKRGLSLINRTEEERISKFVFLEDRKRALIGRLSLRAVISEVLNVPWTRVELSRTERGKPCLTSEFISRYPNGADFNFNISHHGDFVVLAGDRCREVGIDLMRIELPKSSRTLEEFFKTMRRLFTLNEWRFIQSATDEYAKLFNFYRLWTLKESFLKATGQGISLDLQFLEFSIFSPLTLENIQTNTRVSLHQTPQTDWLLEESLIDYNHIVSVAINSPQKPNELTYFELIDISRLIHTTSFPNAS